MLDYYQQIKFILSDASCNALSGIYSESFAKYCTRFGEGFFVTLELLILSSILGIMIAIPFSLMRVSSIKLINVIAYAYVYFFRGTPLLLQLWLVYYGLGSFGPDGWGILWPFFRDGWSVGLVVMTFNTSAYVTEILRGGIINVHKGQVEVAKAVGMSRTNILRYVIFPQAWRIALPAYGNEIVLLLKGSALISTIAVFDLMGVTRSVFSRSYDLSYFMYASFLYIFLALLIGFIVRFFEKRIRLKGGIA